MEHPFHVGAVYDGVIFRIKSLQAVAKPVVAIGLPFLHEWKPYAVRYGRELVDSFDKCVNIHHRSSAYHRYIPSLPDAPRYLQRILLKHRRRIVGIKRQRLHKMMSHPRSLTEVRNGGDYGYSFIYLSGIGGDDLSVVLEGELDGEVCLAGGRRARHYDKFLQGLKAEQVTPL